MLTIMVKPWQVRLTSLLCLLTVIIRLLSGFRKLSFIAKFTMLLMDAGIDGKTRPHGLPCRVSHFPGYPASVSPVAFLVMSVTRRSPAVLIVVTIIYDNR